MLGIFQTVFSPPRDMIFVLVAAWLGMVLAERHASRHGIGKDAVSNLIFYGLLGFIASGRITYAASHLTAFLQSPRSLISLNYALFDPVGGAAAGLLVAAIYGQRKRLEFWSALDALTPFFAVLAVGIGLAHLASGSAYGKPTNVPWGIDLWSAHRHPSQVYETVAALLILAFVWLGRAPSRPGSFFLAFISLSAGARLLLEGFRGDSTFVWGGLRQAQIAAWLILAVSLGLAERRLHTPSRSTASIPDQV